MSQTSTICRDRWDRCLSPNPGGERGRARNSRTGPGYCTALAATAEVLVLDASVVLPACASPEGFALVGDEQLVAPALLWSEARSALHEALWLREGSRAQAPP